MCTKHRLNYSPDAPYLCPSLPLAKWNISHLEFYMKIWQLTSNLHGSRRALPAPQFKTTQTTTIH